MSQFVVNRLRSKPITYSIEISHFVSGGEWMLGLAAHGVDMSTREFRQRVADDLRWAIAQIEDGEWEPTP